MPVIRFRLENGDEVIKQLANLRHESVATAEAAAAGAAEHMLKAVRANILTTFHQRTGRLHDNWVIETKKTGHDRAETTLSTDTVYARIHELGGVITPKRARLLHWIDEETGEHVFARRVTIPARPYFRPAWDNYRNVADAERAAVVEVQKVVDAVLAGRSVMRRSVSLLREYTTKELGW